MAEQKAVCGGFLVGDGLKMEGKVLSAEGGSEGVKYVECHSDSALQNIQCDLSPEQIIDLVKHGTEVVLTVVISGSMFTKYFPITYHSFNADGDMVYFSENEITKIGSKIVGSYNDITVMVGGGYNMFMGSAKRYELTPYTP